VRTPLDGRTIAAIFAHPDDESFATGGLLAASALLGARVVVITATRGEGGTDRRGRGRTPEEIAAIRGRELHLACEALGAESPIQFGFADGSLPEEAGIAEMLAATLKAIDPHVVVTFGPDGAYGHRDHIALTSEVLAAFDALPMAEHRRLLHTAFPPGHFKAFHDRLRDHAPECLESPASFGTARDLVNWVFPLQGITHRKRAAIEAHASQLGQALPLDFLGPGAMAPLLNEEWYVVAAGQSFPETPITSAFEGLP
jgi:LmbE family N-acetylglucosaminyl deacetylase